MKMTNFCQVSALTVFAWLIMIGCISAQNAQTMKDNTSKPGKDGNANSAQTIGSQTSSTSANLDSVTSTTGGLAKYQDKKTDSLPTKFVSLKYVVQHRTALNDKTIQVSGIIVAVGQPSSGNSSGGTRSMKNAQPRIFIADSSKDSRDKNLDLMIIVGEADNNYSVGQKVTFKVKVSGSKTAVVLRKIS